MSKRTGLSSISVSGGGSYSIDASDLLVTVTSDNQIQVQLLGTDWNNMWTGATLNVAINYVLYGDHSTSGNQFSLTVTGLNDAPVLVTSASPIICSTSTSSSPLRSR